MFRMISQQRLLANAVNFVRVAKWLVLLLVLATGLPFVPAYSCAAQDGAYEMDETSRLADDTSFTSFPDEVDTSGDEEASPEEGTVKKAGSTGYPKIVILIVLFLIFRSIFRK